MLSELIIRTQEIKAAEIKVSGQQEELDALAGTMGCIGCSFHIFAANLHEELRCSGLVVGKNRESAAAVIQVSPAIPDTALQRADDIHTHAACLQKGNVYTLLPTDNK